MGQIGGIIGDKCQARAGDGFGEGGGSSGNHRNSARHGFQNRNAEALVNRRHDEHIDRPIAIELTTGLQERKLKDFTLTA